MIPDQMTRCQVTGVFIHVDNICIGSEQCRNEAVYAFDTKEIGVRMVYRCEKHKHSVALHWKKMTVQEAIVYEVLTF